jgi:hypothetical protein
MRARFGMDGDDVGPGFGESGYEWIDRRKALTTEGPIVRLGTKCPSMTSIWM